MYYAYGMRLRGYSPGCQPKEGLKAIANDRKYHNILIYDHQLTEEEIRDYELDDLGEVKDPEGLLTP